MEAQPENPSQVEVWIRIACGAILLLPYVGFFLMAIQVSHETGAYGRAHGLSRMMYSIPFGVLSVVLLLKVFHPKLHASAPACRVAESLVVLWGILTFCLCCQI